MLRTLYSQFSGPPAAGQPHCPEGLLRGPTTHYHLQTGLLYRKSEKEESGLWGDYRVGKNHTTHVYLWEYPLGTGVQGDSIPRVKEERTQ